MKKLIWFSVFLGLMFSCSKLINEPKNLVPKDKMAQILAEMAVSDQLSYIGQSANMENQTRYILKKYDVKGKDFTESYKYYLSTKELQKIYVVSQDIIKEKDPEAADFIEKRIKEEKIKNTPSPK